MYETLRPILDSEWERVARQESRGSEPPGVLWSWRLTPPFPSRWPPGRQTRLVYYAFAEGFDIRLMDAVRVASPWARVDVDPAGDAPPSVARLAEGVREVGIQGMRPLSAEELSEGPPAESVEALLARALLDPAAAEAARPGLSSHYGFWSRNNGVIAGEVLPRHEEFFRWLAERNGEAGYSKE